MIEVVVVFLCPYGGAKSVIAAEHFNRAAQREGLPYVAVARAAEEPYDAVPKPVADLLAREGIDVAAFQPRHVASADLADAERVIAIDCELPTNTPAGRTTERWTDVPKVSEDLAGSVAAIRRHVDALVCTLASSSR